MNGIDMDLGSRTELMNGFDFKKRKTIFGMLNSCLELYWVRVVLGLRIVGQRGVS